MRTPFPDSDKCMDHTSTRNATASMSSAACVTDAGYGCARLPPQHTDCSVVQTAVRLRTHTRPRHGAASLGCLLQPRRRAARHRVAITLLLAWFAPDTGAMSTGRLRPVT